MDYLRSFFFSWLVKNSWRGAAVAGQVNKPLRAAVLSLPVSQPCDVLYKHYSASRSATATATGSIQPINEAGHGTGRDPGVWGHMLLAGNYYGQEPAATAIMAGHNRCRQHVLGIMTLQVLPRHTCGRHQPPPPQQPPPPSPIQQPPNSPSRPPPKPMGLGGGCWLGGRAGGGAMLSRWNGSTFYVIILPNSVNKTIQIHTNMALSYHLHKIKKIHCNLMMYIDRNQTEATAGRWRF